MDRRPRISRINFSDADALDIEEQIGTFERACDDDRHEEIMTNRTRSTRHTFGGLFGSSWASLRFRSAGTVSGAELRRLWRTDRSESSERACSCRCGGTCCARGVGRRRLRAGSTCNAQPPTIETRAARACRLVDQLQKYHGDLEILAVVARRARWCRKPVSDYVVDHCLFVVASRATKSSFFACGPLARRFPIVLAGDRTDAEIAETCRIEVAHAWLSDQAAQAPTALNTCGIRNTPKRSWCRS